MTEEMVPCCPCNGWSGLNSALVALEVRGSLVEAPSLLPCVGLLGWLNNTGHNVCMSTHECLGQGLA